MAATCVVLVGPAVQVKRAQLQDLVVEQKRLSVEELAVVLVDLDAALYQLAEQDPVFQVLVAINVPLLRSQNLDFDSPLRSLLDGQVLDDRVRVVGRDDRDLLLGLDQVVEQLFLDFNVMRARQQQVVVFPPNVLAVLLPRNLAELLAHLLLLPLLLAQIQPPRLVLQNHVVDFGVHFLGDVALDPHVQVHEAGVAVLLAPVVLADVAAPDEDVVVHQNDLLVVPLEQLPVRKTSHEILESAG